METKARGRVPDFGMVIQRESLLRVFIGQRPGLTLICAPPGYGKSVLAAQLVAAAQFDDVLWVSGLDEDMHAERLLVSAAVAMASSRGDEISSNGSSPLSHEDALLVIGETLQGCEQHSTCLVLDGCNRLDGVALLQDLAALLRSHASSLSSLIVTCRGINGDLPLNPAQTWMVESQDLTFSTQEIESLSSIIGRPLLDEVSCSKIASRYRGHPALTCLMLRHSSLDEETRPPRDLVWYVDRLVVGLSTPALELLYVAALLKEDSFEVLAHCADVSPTPRTWEEFLSLSPLLVLRLDPSGIIRGFRVHAVLADSISRCAAASVGSKWMREARRRVLDHLHSAGGYARMCAVLQSTCGEAEIAYWCAAAGGMMLRFEGSEVITRLLDLIEPSTLSGSPRLLLLRARAFRERECYQDARESASLAASLADAQGDRGLWADAVLALARLGIDSGDWQSLADVLTELQPASASNDDSASQRLLGAYQAVAESQRGHIGLAVARAESLVQSLGVTDDMGSDEAVFTVNALAAVEGIYAGRWSNAARLLRRVTSRNDLSPCQRFLVRANLAVCYLEIGMLSEAKTLLDEVIDAAENAGLKHLAVHAYGTRSSVLYALGRDEQGLSDYQLCDRMLLDLGHDDVRVAEHVQAAMNRRALGLRDEALGLVEEAQLVVQQGTAGYLIPSHILDLEMAASCLSFGDSWAARRAAAAVTTSSELGAVEGYAVRAALLSAEAARSDAAATEGVRAVAALSEYILSGSANRLIALYVRAFPGLLGVLAKAIGAENIPLRLLLMIPPDTLEHGIAMASEYLSEEDASILRRRRGAESAEVDESEAAPAKAPSAHTCYARLFGGLEVTTEAGIVDEASWRKRKARLLFVILALRQHQDIPREVLLERLWPEMDEEHAKRNFYVTWSTMKRALACGGSPAIAKPLVQCSGGVCRATRLVRSDLDEFDEALANLRRAAASGDAGVAIASARFLVEVYRGELLPGDLYEEWLTDTRERTKHDFCDAMMLAASLAETTGDFEAALLFLRKASAADPWREDVYQATMRCQMNSGQRSRAIETYLSCRSRLTEDLGIDPSIETTKLYQAVLAMEDCTPEG